MNTNGTLGGIIHTYQKYDPLNFPKPSGDAPDLASAAMEHMLQYGNTRRLTPEELARAVKIDPSQIKGLGPSLDALAELLKQRRDKILKTFETTQAQQQAHDRFHQAAGKYKPPKKLAPRFDKAVREEQLRDLENLYYAVGDDRDPFARSLPALAEKLGDKYQIDEMAGKYDFTGSTPMDVPKALEVKEELDTIEKLLKQIEEAKQTAQIGVIDMDELAEFVEGQDLEGLKAMHEQINEYIRQEAERQGLEIDKKGLELTPKAYRLFQSKLLSTIFSQLQASRTGRHQQGVVGEGATELLKTKPYEFGDSVANMDIPATIVNALLRTPPGEKLRLKTDDILIHRTQNKPKAATSVLLDMSGSMRYDGMYANVKRMGLALEGLIRSEYPGDFLQFVEMYTFGKARHASEVAGLMPKPVTIFNPVVRLKVDMADPEVTEMQLPPHFTNIQHAMQIGRRHLAAQNTPNRQMCIITDGLPTAHFEGSMLYLLYPPDPRTEEATLREAQLCAKEGIVINIFLLQSWNQSQEDVRFAYKMAEMTRGRVIFTAGRELDRFVVWDYITMRKQIVA